jgi:hypothetical protein
MTQGARCETIILHPPFRAKEKMADGGPRFLILLLTDKRAFRIIGRMKDTKKKKEK